MNKKLKTAIAILFGAILGFLASEARYKLNHDFLAARYQLLGETCERVSKNDKPVYKGMPSVFITLLRFERERFIRDNSWIKSQTKKDYPIIEAGVGKIEKFITEYEKEAQSRSRSQEN